MIASGANGFQNTDPNTCAGANYNFHPEYDTAKFDNSRAVGGAAGECGILAMELGHFEPGVERQMAYSDDAPCFSGPGDLVPGCLRSRHRLRWALVCVRLVQRLTRSRHSGDDRLRGRTRGRAPEPVGRRQAPSISPTRSCNSRARSPILRRAARPTALAV